MDEQLLIRVRLKVQVVIFSIALLTGENTADIGFTGCSVRKVAAHAVWMDRIVYGTISGMEHPHSVTTVVYACLHALFGAYEAATAAGNAFKRHLLQCI